MRINQRQRIINYIRQFGSITSFEAYSELGITQLGARITELEQEGYKFKKEWNTSKNKLGEPISFKKYYLNDLISENMNHIPQI